MKKTFLIFSLFSFLFSLGITFGYSSEDVSNANYLADQKIVTKQTTTTGYRLDDKILRQEVIGMALKVKGITLPENYTCKKYFADATKNDWVCRAVELAADNGIITRSNKYANPGKSVTRAEALAMVMSAGGYNAPSGATPPIFPYSDVDISSWQADVILYAAGLGIIANPNVIPLSEGFKIIENVKPIKFYPNLSATRAEVFAFARNITEKKINDLWSIFDKHVLSLKNKNISSYNETSYSQITSEEEPNFLEFVPYLYDMVAKIDKSNYVNTWQDDKQAIFSTIPKKENTPESYSYEQSIIMFIKEKGVWKVLSVGEPTWGITAITYIGGPRRTQAEADVSLMKMMIDSDQDGLSDNQETCTGASQYDSKCTKTEPNKKDTNGDGLWDGINKFIKEDME